MHKDFKKKLNKLPLKIQNQFYARLDVFMKDKADATLNNQSVDKVLPTAEASMCQETTERFSKKKIIRLYF